MKTFEEYKQENGIPDTIGIRMIITHELIKRGVPDAIEAVARQMGFAFARKLFQGYKIPTSKIFFLNEKKYDPTLKAWSHYFSMDIEKEWLPEQFIYMAEQEIAKWENMNLWGYFKYWFKRKFFGGR
jgi:hypothetical protein